MSTISNTVEYIFRLKDNVSAAANQASQDARAAGQDVRAFKDDMQEANSVSETVRQGMTDTRAEVRTAASEIGSASDDAEKSMREARSEASTTISELNGAADAIEKIDRQSKQIDLVTQLTTIMGMREGVSAITGGLIGLGVVAGEDAEQLNKVNAAFSLFAGAVTTIKTVQAVMQTLNATEAAGAVITAFRAAVSNPVGIALVGAGLGAAAGVAGAMLVSSTTNNSREVSITVQDTTPRDAVSEVYQIVGGGAL